MICDAAGLVVAGVHVGVVQAYGADVGGDGGQGVASRQLGGDEGDVDGDDRRCRDEEGPAAGQAGADRHRPRRQVEEGRQRVQGDEDGAGVPREDARRGHGRQRDDQQPPGELARTAAGDQ